MASSAACCSSINDSRCTLNKSIFSTNDIFTNISRKSHFESWTPAPAILGPSSEYVCPIYEFSDLNDVYVYDVYCGV